MAKKPVRAAKKAVARKATSKAPAKASTSTPWAKLEASPEFAELKRAKLAFIVPAVIFFLVYYASLLILVGYAPELMSRKVFGALNVAYVFALSQFLMVFVLAAVYVRAAGRFDAQAAQVVALAGKGGAK